MTSDFIGTIRELIEVLKAQRPELSVQYSKAKSAREVADILYSSVVGYGENPVVENEDGTYTVTATGIDAETIDGAFKYLWWKPVPGQSGVYAMSGIPYTITVAKKGSGVEMTVSEKK